MEKMWHARPSMRHLLTDGLAQARSALDSNHLDFLAPSFPGMTGHNDYRLIQSQRLHKSESDSRRASILQWSKHGLLSTNWPIVIFLMEGQCDIRFGLTHDEQRPALALSPEVGQYVVTMKPSQFLLIPSHVPRSDGSDIHWERDDRNNASSVLMWLIFNSIGCLVHFCKTCKGNHTQTKSIYLPAPHTFRLANELEAEIMEAKTSWKAAAHNYLELLVIAVQRQIAFSDSEADLEIVTNKAPDTKESAHSRNLQIACNFIEDNLHEPLLLSEIAHSTGVSVRHLSQLFRSNLETSVAQYVMARRLERAVTLLRDSNMTVGLVARQSGFNHGEHFSRTFKHHIGESPLAYRRRCHEADKMACNG